MGANPAKEGRERSSTGSKPSKDGSNTPPVSRNDTSSANTPTSTASGVAIPRQAKDTQLDVIAISPTETRYHGPQESEDYVPTVFTWTGGGKSVYIVGTFNNWQAKLPLHKSEKDFTIILNAKPGVHQYKFLVDGKWRYAADQPVAADMNGNLNNCIEVAKPRTLTTSDTNFKPSSPPGEYSTLIPSQEEYGGKEPPVMPPHLLRALLNTQPPTADPTLLPLPHHVMLNHLYTLQRREGVVILGSTSRYKNKFVTTVFYKPLSTAQPSSPSSHPTANINHPMTVGVPISAK